MLGLGVFEAPTLGMTLYWVNYTGAMINGWWWWWLPPIIVVGMLFIGLFLTAVGLDEIANPRLRNRVWSPRLAIVCSHSDSGGAGLAPAIRHVANVFAGPDSPSR